MFFRCLFAAASIAQLVANEADARNPEYRCVPATVANDAVAFAYADVDVGVFSDPNDRICTFAIDGAAATGSERTPIKQVIDQVYEGDYQQLIIRLTVARQATDPDVEKIRERIGSLLADASEDLISCFKALEAYGREGGPEPKVYFDNGVPAYLLIEDGEFSIQCSISDPGEYFDIRSEFPMLRLRSISIEDKSQDSLFVPVEAIR